MAFETVALLVEVVYKHHALSDLPGLAAFLPRERTVLLLHALDMAAIYWGLDRVKKVRTRHSTVVVLGEIPND